MSKISSMMDTGKRSMMNSQTALQTVGHNIANKTTEGYSRQRVDIQSAGAIGEGSLRIGMGSKAAGVSRINNPYLEKQIEKETQNNGYMQSRADGLSRVEQVYNEQSNKGLNQYMTDFFNAFRELSNSPESLTSRTLVQQTGQALAKDFNRVHGQLKEVQYDIDTQIKAEVEEVNQISKEIAQLNEKVQQVEIQGIPANDERDRRDVLLKKLAEKIDITYGEDPQGMVSVTAGRSAVLVSGYSSTDLKAERTNDRDRVELFFSANGSTNNISRVTDLIKGGSIGGALDVRDNVIENLHDRMDTLAYSFANEINNAHVEGFDRNGRPGLNFFEVPTDGSLSVAGELKMNDVILNDASRIAAGVHPNAPSDNTVANVISALQHRQTMEDGTSTFDDFYGAQVGQVGVLAQRADKSLEAQGHVMSQLTNLRESISGVNLDEEATKMIEYQKAFEASARLIKTADEMLDTVLNLKRI